MYKVVIKNIISNISSMFNGYKLIKIPNDSTQIIETNNITISLTFNKGMPKLDYNNQKKLTKISDIK